MVDEFEKQELYSYMDLEDRTKYRRKFKNIFEPFNCHEKPEAQKISNKFVIQNTHIANSVFLS